MHEHYPEGEKVKIILPIDYSINSKGDLKTESHEDVYLQDAKVIKYHSNIDKYELKFMGPNSHVANKDKGHVLWKSSQLGPSFFDESGNSRLATAGYKPINMDDD